MRYLDWLKRELKRFPEEREAEIFWLGEDGWIERKVGLVARCYHPVRLDS